MTPPPYFLITVMCLLGGIFWGIVFSLVEIFIIVREEKRLKSYFSKKWNHGLYLKESLYFVVGFAVIAILLSFVSSYLFMVFFWFSASSLCISGGQIGLRFGIKLAIKFSKEVDVSKYLIYKI